MCACVCVRAYFRLSMRKCACDPGANVPKTFKLCANLSCESLFVYLSAALASCPNESRCIFHVGYLAAWNSWERQGNRALVCLEHSIHVIISILWNVYIKAQTCVKVNALRNHVGNDINITTPCRNHQFVWFVVPSLKDCGAPAMCVHGIRSLLKHEFRVQTIVVCLHAHLQYYFRSG